MGDEHPPLLERGDFVRLKEPYLTHPDTMDVELKRTLMYLTYHRQGDIELSRHFDTPEAVPLSLLAEREGGERFFEFTHGVVAEIVSRFPVHNLSPWVTKELGLNSPTGGPPRNVSLHLFNSMGLMYVGGHPTEPIKPEFVDFHVSDLVLLHKHDERWGNDHQLDIKEQYESWDLPMP